jgi:hypothetical protein
MPQSIPHGHDFKILSLSYLLLNFLVSRDPSFRMKQQSFCREILQGPFRMPCYLFC